MFPLAVYEYVAKKTGLAPDDGKYRTDPLGLVPGQRKPAGRTTVLGVGEIGRDPENVEDEYQRRLRGVLDQRQREEEAAAFGAQRQRILGAMQPSTVATEAAREQAREAGMATMGAARSQIGVAGTQTAGLAALGAGQAQQAGMAGAAEVAAAEQQRNALARAQMAELMRQQSMAQMGFERADLATALGGQRALMMPELELQQDYATREAERQRRREGATYQAIATGVAAGSR